MAFKFAGESVRGGETDVSIAVMLRRTSDSQGKVGVSTANVTLSYWRAGATPTSFASAALSTISAAHTDGGWEPVSTGRIPGLYRLDVPDAAFAHGAEWTVVAVKTTSAFLSLSRFPIVADGLVRAATPQAYNSTSITLDSGASTVDDKYNGCVVTVVKSTKAQDVGQSAFITDYAGGTRKASLGYGWDGLTPTSTGAANMLVTVEAGIGYKTHWRELSRSTAGVLSFKDAAGNTLFTQTETRSTSLGPITALA